MVIETYILLIGWYVFILYMLHLVSTKVKFVKEEEDKINKLKTKRMKTMEEQIRYTKLLEETRMNAPFMLVIITVYSIMVLNIFKFGVNIIKIIYDPIYFIIGLILCIIISFVYSWFITYKIQPTKNKEYYLLILFLYGMFLSVSILINLLYSTKMIWWIMLIIIIITYIICKKIMKWDI